MASDTKHVEFTFDWKIRWADYDRIDRIGSRRYFITSFNNVSFQWYAKLTLCVVEGASKIGFHIYYGDGPLDKISGVSFKVGVVKSDQSLRGIQSSIKLEYQREYMRVCTTGFAAWGWNEFDDKNSTGVRTKYGLTDSDSLTYQITIKIPTETFAYRMPSPVPAPCSPWAIKLYNSINNAEEDTSLSDTKIAGRDGIVFTCDKVIVAAQSEALKTIFRYPPAQEESGDPAPEDEEQSVASPKKRKASAMDEHSTTSIQGTGDVYTFPNLCAASLKSVLEYLYTGKVTTSTLTVTELIEMGDAGEQYDLKAFKEFCAAELWKRVVIEEPSYAFEIARFANLHDELKYLKHRSLDVIVENYDRLGVKADELTKRFGGTRGKELHNEFMEYAVRRLCPIIKE